MSATETSVIAVHGSLLDYAAPVMEQMCRQAGSRFPGISIPPPSLTLVKLPIEVSAPGSTEVGLITSGRQPSIVRSGSLSANWYRQLTLTIRLGFSNLVISGRNPLLALY